jgi:hypothetical protein
VERQYILDSIEAQQGKAVEVGVVIGHFAEILLVTVPHPQPPTPWKAIFTCRAVWALAIMHFCQNWGFYTLLTCMPSFFNDVLLFNISKGGFDAGFPYLAQFAVTLFAGQMADFLRSRHYLSTTAGEGEGQEQILGQTCPHFLAAVRKMFNTLAYILSSIFLILAGYVSAGHVGWRRGILG